MKLSLRILGLMVVIIAMSLSLAGCSLFSPAFGESIEDDPIEEDPIEVVNLLTNTGFEVLKANGLPENWSLYASSGSTAGLQVSNEARTGDYAALIVVEDGRVDGGTVRIRFGQKFNECFDEVDTEEFDDCVGIGVPGDTYRFSAYYRTEGDPRGELRIQIPGLTHPFVILDAEEDWTYGEVEFVWPPKDKWIDFGLWVYNGVDGKIWFDDVSLIKVEE